MKNEKGQTLVVFVLLLPLIVLLLSFLVDATNTLYETKKLDELNRTVLSYLLDNKEVKVENVKELLLKNDQNVILLTFEETPKLHLVLKKEVKSIFLKVIGIKKYDITSNLYGYLINNEKRIEK